MLTADIDKRVRTDPDLKRTRDYITWAGSRMVDLVVDKVVAHHEDPRGHPLPSDARSMERRLYALFEALPRRRQRDIVDAVKSRLKASARAAHYRDLAAVDLENVTPVVIQAKSKLEKAAPRLSSAAIDRIRTAFPESLRKRTAPSGGATGKRPRAPGMRRGLTPRGIATQRLVLRLESVRCVKKTRELFEGRDEIGIQAFGFDEEALIESRTTFDNFFELGKFKDGEEKAQSGLQLGAFEFDPNAGFPQGFRSVLVLGELDRVLFKSPTGDGIAAILLTLLIIIGALAAFILTDGYIGAPLIMSLTGGTLPFLLQIISFVSDEVFEPENVAVFVDDVAQAFEQQTRTFRLGEGILGLMPRIGEYQVTVRYEIA